MTQPASATPPVHPPRQRIRPVYVLPNLFTAASIFCGLMSVISTADGQYVRACYLIFLAAVLDALDGPVARFTRTASSFGLQFDSLADVISFGLAPAFLMYNKLAAIDQNVDVPLPAWAPRMAIGVCALFAICGAVRLARFNIQVSSEEKLHFTGLPIPAAAGGVVSSFLVIEEYLSETRGLHRLILILMLLLSYLMVSTIPFPSLKGLNRRLRRSFANLVTAIFLICLLVMFKEHLPAIAFFSFMTYLATSVIAVIRAKRRLASYSPGLPGDQNGQ